MDRFLARSHAHSSDRMQGGRTWFQAHKTQQPTPRVCDAPLLRLKNVRRGMAGRARERGAGPAALVGRRGSPPGRRVRGCTLEPVWSTSSEKGDGRALSGRMGRLSRASLLSNFRTTGALVKPRRGKDTVTGIPHRLSTPIQLVQTGSRVLRDYGWPMWCLGRVWDSLNRALHGGMRGCA